MPGLPKMLRRFYGNAIWQINTPGHVYLTFDDGPHPELTPQILDILDDYNAKATFFLIGEHVQKHPELLRAYRDRGHAVGNHSMRHLNGWKVSAKDAFEDFQNCESIFSSKLYRPPYGKVRIKNIKRISKSHQIVMWDVLSKDYTKWSAQRCFDRIKKESQAGSIILLHENEKSKDKIIDLLKKCLDHFQEMNWKCATISE